MTSDTLKERREQALHMLQEPAGELVARTRLDCASGAWSKTVAAQRARQQSATADAADMCAMALTRVARDRGLLGLYAKLVVDLAGDPATVPTLPEAIGAAVTKAPAPTVAIGNQRGAKITPALALDAGYTVAQQKGARNAQGMPDLPVIRPIAERCLAQEEANLALCYSTGYVYAARAASGLTLVP